MMFNGLETHSGVVAEGGTSPAETVRGVGPVAQPSDGGNVAKSCS